MKNRTLLFVAATLFAISPMIAGNTAISKKTLVDSKTTTYCGVSADEIYAYMSRNGIQVTAISPITGSCNVLVKAIDGKTYIVYIVEGIIEGYDNFEQ